MGCIVSRQKSSGGNRRWPKNVGEIAMFVPGLRIPKPVDFTEAIGDGISRSSIEKLSALRTRIVVMAGQEAPMPFKPRRTATRHGGSTLSDLQQALEDYLPVLLGLVKSENSTQHRFQFSWLNQEDNAEETSLSNSWYEVLSVLHLMAMLSLSQANLLLLPKASNDGINSKTPEAKNYWHASERRHGGIEILLKAAGYLEFCIEHVLPQIPPQLRKDLPVDLSERVLHSLCLQALTQLGIAINSAKASMAVKRRLACEMVKYWFQAHENVADLPLANGWGKKHKLFIQWKRAEAKAAAYYYHGLILEEGNPENYNAAQLSAEEFFKESKKAAESFHNTLPLSRNPPLWGTSKFLSEKIPENNSTKTKSTDKSDRHEEVLQVAPELPDFALSLKADEYKLPVVDPDWN